MITNENYKDYISKSDELILKFGADWCGPCKMIDPIIEDLKKSDYFNYEIQSINVDEMQKVSQEYNVRGIPTIIFFKDGKPVHKLTGAFAKATFINETETAFPPADLPEVDN